VTGFPVQVIQITIQELRRQLTIERMVRELRLFQEVGRQPRDIGFSRARGGPRRRRLTAKIHRAEARRQPENEEEGRKSGWRLHGVCSLLVRRALGKALRIHPRTPVQLS
jgi:hypothetical protein